MSTRRENVARFVLVVVLVLVLVLVLVNGIFEIVSIFSRIPAPRGLLP